MTPLFAVTGFATALFGVWWATRTRGPDAAGPLLRRWACAGHVLSSAILVAFLAALLGPEIGLGVALLQVLIIARAWAWPWLERFVVALGIAVGTDIRRAAVLSCAGCGARNRVRSDWAGNLPSEAICGRCRAPLW